MSVQQQHRYSCLCNMWACLYNITCVFSFFSFHWKNWNAPTCRFDQIFVLLEFLAAERFGIRPYFIDVKIQLTSAAVPLAIKPRVDFRTAIQIYKTRCVNTNTSSLARVYTTAWATARPSSSRPTQRASEMATFVPADQYIFIQTRGHKINGESIDLMYDKLAWLVLLSTRVQQNDGAGYIERCKLKWKRPYRPLSSVNGHSRHNCMGAVMISPRAYIQYIDPHSTTPSFTSGFLTPSVCEKAVGIDCGCRTTSSPNNII